MPTGPIAVVTGRAPEHRRSSARPRSELPPSQPAASSTSMRPGPLISILMPFDTSNIKNEKAQRDFAPGLYPNRQLLVVEEQHEQKDCTDRHAHKPKDDRHWLSPLFGRCGDNVKPMYTFLLCPVNRRSVPAWYTGCV